MKWVALAIVGLGLVLGGRLAWNYFASTTAPTVQQELPVDMSMRSVHLQGGEHGERKWELQAENATYDRDAGVVDLDHPVLTLPMQNGSSVVRALQGRYNQENGEAAMWPDVVAEYQNGTAQADRALFIRQHERLELRDNVVFNWPGLQVSGAAADIELDTEIVIVKGGVQADLESRQGEAQKDKDL
ncbi:MAG: LPS export ABC transporter periplasmic protein LptC [Desulfohalobium sp.]